MNRTHLGVAAMLAVGAIASSASAQVWAVQPGTGRILTINPANGAILNQFGAPDALAGGQRNIGLSIAEGDSTLIYHNSDNNNAVNYRLNPATGVLLSIEGKDGWTVDGLSWQQGATGAPLIYTSHSSGDVHRQVGYGGSDTFFWEGAGVPRGGLGGDGHGREFMIATDGNIYEYDPFNAGVTLNFFPAPFTPGAAFPLEGLAFDGASLYASDTVGTLYTLDPNTGAILNTVTVQGGGLYGLGAVIPAPASIGLLGLLGVASGRRRR